MSHRYQLLKAIIQMPRIAIAILFLLGLPSTANAYQTLGQQFCGPGLEPVWPDGNFDYKIDLASFTASPGAGGLNSQPIATSNQAQFWVGFAGGAWKQRTSAAINLSYTGGTTAVCGEIDGINTVGVIRCTDPTNPPSVVAMCANPATASNLVLTVIASSCSAKEISEADICVIGDRGNFEVATAGLSSTEYDLIGLLTNAFGQALGLVPVAGSNSVMGSLQLTNQSNQRYPLGDDIDGVRFLYGKETSTQAQWAERACTSCSWGSSTNVMATNMGVDGAVGGESSGSANDEVVVAHVYPVNDRIAFKRKIAPISTLNFWSYYYLGCSPYYTAWQPPSVVSDTGIGSYRWLMAWFGQLNVKSDCTGGGNGLHIARSDGSFAPSTIAVTQFGTTCSVHSSALVHDDDSGWFAAFYVNRNFNSQVNNGCDRFHRVGPETDHARRPA